MAAGGVKRGRQERSARVLQRRHFVVVDGVFLLMDADNCSGRESGAGPGAAELVKEWLNMHLPSPETLIKEERGPVPDAHVILIYQNGGFL